MKNKSYSLLGWIENLGVVPLFLFSAFLLWPDFFNLLARLFFVTRVRDTISQLLKKIIHSYQIIRSQFLYYLPHSVKIFIILCSYFLEDNGQGARLIPTERENIILSIGEHVEITTKNMKKYSVGNSDIVNHKLQKPSLTLLIKGKKTGHTELIIWFKGLKKKKYFIYVLTKKKQLQVVNSTQTFKKMGLKTKFIGSTLLIEGKLHLIDDYLLFHQTLKNNKNALFHNRAKLSRILRRDLIGIAYSHLFNENLKNFFCTDESLTIVCRISKDSPPSKNLQSFLKNHYFIQFFSTRPSKDHSNFSIKMKIIQLENYSGNKNNLGLYPIQGELDYLFKKDYKSFINKNQIYFSKYNIKFEEIATPYIISQINKEIKIKMGSEIPYIVEDTQSQSPRSKTKWKFAGLNLKLKINQKDNDIFLKYSTRFTKDDKNKNISGSQQSSSIKIKLNTTIKLFELTFTKTAVDFKKIPLLSSLPFLGNLFSSKSKIGVETKIFGFILIKELIDENTE